MSFYKETIFLITSAIMVSSCNLKPIYQSDLKDRPLENKVSVENIDTDIGFYLAQNLRFALNDFGSKKRLNLITEIEISENKYSFSSSNEATINLLSKNFSSSKGSSGLSSSSFS